MWCLHLQAREKIERGHHISFYRAPLYLFPLSKAKAKQRQGQRPRLEVCPDSCPVRVAARAIASPCDLNQIEYFICNVFFYIVNYHDSMHKCVRVQIYHSSSFCTFPAKCLPPFSSSSINRGLH